MPDSAGAPTFPAMMLLALPWRCATTLRASKFILASSIVGGLGGACILGGLNKAVIVSPIVA